MNIENNMNLSPYLTVKVYDTVNSQVAVTDMLMKTANYPDIIKKESEEKAWRGFSQLLGNFFKEHSDKMLIPKITWGWDFNFGLLVHYFTIKAVLYEIKE